MSVPIPDTDEREAVLLRKGLFGMPALGCKGAPLSLGRFLGRRPWGLWVSSPSRPVELRRSSRHRGDQDRYFGVAATSCRELVRRAAGHVDLDTLSPISCRNAQCCQSSVYQERAREWNTNRHLHWQLRRVLTLDHAMKQPRRSTAILVRTECTEVHFTFSANSFGNRQRWFLLARGPHDHTVTFGEDEKIF